MKVLERKKLKFRSFTVWQFQSFFVSCRRTYVLKNVLRKKNCMLMLFPAKNACTNIGLRGYFANLRLNKPTKPSGFTTA